MLLLEQALDEEATLLRTFDIEVDLIWNVPFLPFLRRGLDLWHRRLGNGLVRRSCCWFDHLLSLCSLPRNRLGVSVLLGGLIGHRRIRLRGRR